MLGFGPDRNMLPRMGVNQFAHREKFRSAYATVADALCANFRCCRVLDIGAGQGFLVDELVKRGRSIVGIEREAEAIAFMSPQAKECVLIGDALNAHLLPGDFDLVTCIEVAEHLAPETTGKFLDTVSVKVTEDLYFTADTTPSRLHINLHPHEWWIEQLEARGMVLDREKTEAMRGASHSEIAPWIARNSFVFARGVT